MSNKPEPNVGDYPWEPDRIATLGYFEIAGRFLADLVRVPTHWVRENIVEANRGPRYYWYHKKFDKALPIDECYFDDAACVHEADIEFKRGFLVDRATLELLRYRRDQCHYWMKYNNEYDGPSENCQNLVDTCEAAELNFHIKYGDTRYKSGVREAYAKQKHRMIMERRIALKKQATDGSIQENQEQSQQNESIRQEES